MPQLPPPLALELNLSPMSANPLTADLPGAPTATGVGLGYGISIAVGILVLVSTIMLASYVCVRVKGRNRGDHLPTTATALSAPSFSLGLDGPTIDSFPKFIYGAAAAPPKPVAGLCPICLSEYQDGDAIRVVPDCKHSFHVDCVDEWLRVNPTCPLCRNSPVPSAAATPVATPLSELIPLALHAR